MSKLIKKVVSVLAIIAISCTVFSAQASASSVDSNMVPSIAPYVLINNNHIIVEPGTTVEQLGLSYANNTGVNLVRTGTPGEIFIEFYVYGGPGWQSSTSTEKLTTGSAIIQHHFFKTSIISSTTYYIAVRGDVTGDGKVDTEDILYINNYYLGVSPFSNEFTVAADVNLDGVIDIYDILAIQTYIITGQWNL